MSRPRSPDAKPLSPLAAELSKVRAKRRKSVDATERAAATQVAIAKALNVAQATVSGWERGEDLPKPERLPTVAKVYAINEKRLKSLWLASVGSMAA